MQEVLRREFSEIAGKASEDFAVKLKVKEEEDLPPMVKEEEAEEEEEEEFSFVIASADGSPISADDIFEDGRIRPVYPFFYRKLLFSGEDSGDRRLPLKKVFVEESEEEAEGPYCEWDGKAPPRVVEASLGGGGACKKSNSTGFSKIWRFREFVLRSNSDGKDAFVFLHHNNNNNNNHHHHHHHRHHHRNINNNKEKKQGKGKETESFQVYYARNKAAKEGDKRRSYLPYRKDLVGFFTNVNGLSRNLHPF